MTRNSLILAAAGGSLALMLGALGFQYIGELPPCKLCYWQRYPHVAAIAIGLVALALPGRVLPALGALAALSTAAVGAYHAGVERGWWPGPDTCTSGDIGGLSTDDLMNQIMNAPMVRCDDIAWQLMGISMAGWNAILSLVLAGLWIAAFRKS
ncbi:disulfide bond formation protein B [Roseivivax sp. THAF40]|uniref:disulfide bond formation protein B n=1 Tax=unclassified Roseivivax TaxID=2639302 RepID=UPI0012687BF0|nr:MULTISPECIES: disulfide bond formation protein B [unclassified Roseivivax]QFS83355.1 disulfide bond formation protein B [Roseivivax sp. THAF197b]QFT47099.1 disulfide bond formation protein B [Roseivivax sp. THAF40]